MKQNEAVMGRSGGVEGEAGWWGGTEYSHLRTVFSLISGDSAALLHIATPQTIPFFSTLNISSNTTPIKNLNSAGERAEVEVLFLYYLERSEGLSFGRFQIRLGITLLKYPYEISLKG
jgi:hypothetical protein